MRKILGIMLAMALLCTGCGNVNGVEIESIGSESTDEVVETPNGENLVVDYGIVESYQGEYDQVSFNLEVMVPEAMRTAEAEAMVTGKVKLMKANIDPVFEFLLDGDEEEYPLSTTLTENEYGEEIERREYSKYHGQGAFTSVGENTFSSGLIYHTPSELQSHWNRAFELDKEYDTYNAHLYSTTDQLSFQPREDAWAMVEEILVMAGLDTQYVYTGYALDYQIMKDNEYSMGMDGKEDTSVYKESWSEADNAYFFAARQTHQGIPIYSIKYELWKGVNDDLAPVQAYVSPKGIENMTVERIYTVIEETPVEQIPSIEELAQVVADKMGRIEGRSYDFTSAELFYYVDILTGKGEYDMVPIWVVRGMQTEGGVTSEVELLVDAQTLKFY